ncbi:MAG: bifunctional phosphopantothenoylcysteine decarboxylase/phosphopantothenate--cysteine ligase CoaBC [Candidatus Tectomicrobia bacterium]|nr:bifunctional phosphopantothenoylcysteine decarboxylase/phosphopantothenate--cysteine ligase CoaBC [Candidatus Tectomicrobia bacterium]
MSGALAGKRIVLGVSGGIAAYKAVELARQLALQGAEVQATLTRSALAFVQPLPFEVLTGRAPISRMFPIEGAAHPGDMPHISLTGRADLIVIAPATANLIGKFAGGIGDDFLSTLLLSARSPVLVVPAMNPRMWSSPAVRENVKKLRERGHLVMEPGVGRMARAEEGEGSGRMPEPEAILAEVLRLLAPPHDLAGMRLVVSAGPTRERWDAVRYLTNRSSGKMGYALAAAAAARGAEVTLVSGPAGLPDPPGLRTVRVESAAEMREAVLAAWKEAHAGIMAAAVSDYRPARATAHKQKKKEGPLTLKLERTADILAEMGKAKGKRLLVGFAAETGDLTKNAKDKFRRKGLDLIVANRVAGEEDAMGADAATAILIRAGGKEEHFPRLRKDALASAILDRLAEMWQKVKSTK